MDENWREQLADILIKNFCFYGAVGRGKTRGEVLEELQSTDFHLVARAEYSGCEGCYCEVARVETEVYRYAFCKYFGGEIDENVTGDYDTAHLLAERINAFFPGADLVHSLSNYPQKGEIRIGDFVKRSPVAHQHGQAIHMSIDTPYRVEHVTKDGLLLLKDFLGVVAVSDVVRQAPAGE
jgi:hypothetical protein